ncbi:hypothetical protein SAMN05444580_1381, partial [Rhodococcus tukisamuensis]
MQNKKIRGLVTPLGVGALVGVTMLGGVPANATSFNTTFNNTCKITPSAVASPTSETQAASLAVNAPDTVNAGDTFDVTIIPPPISFPNSSSGASVQNVSRVKIDVLVPDNADYIGADILQNTSVGLSGVTPSLLRVNENGNPDPNGAILRLSGNNQTIGNGPNSSKSSEGGIVAKATSGTATTFQLPQVTAHLRARSAGDVSLKLRTAGAAGTFGNDANFLTFLPKATLVITAWAPTQCSPRDGETAPLNAGAGPLSTTRIIEADKQTTTTVVAPGSVKNGSEVTLTANVNPA